jgi:GH15 family glucan-1,4-alpha-glucosidase
VPPEVTAIADYGLLGDCQGAALVSGDGSVGWWCPTRFDAPSVFGRLLDQNVGRWSVRPVEDTARATGTSMTRWSSTSTSGAATVSCG